MPTLDESHFLVCEPKLFTGHTEEKSYHKADWFHFKFKMTNFELVFSTVWLIHWVSPVGYALLNFISYLVLPSQTFMFLSTLNVSQWSNLLFTSNFTYLYLKLGWICVLFPLNSSSLTVIWLPSVAILSQTQRFPFSVRFLLDYLHQNINIPSISSIRFPGFPGFPLLMLSFMGGFVNIHTGLKNCLICCI